MFVEMPEIVYQIAYLKTFKEKCQRKPKDMRPIDMSLKSNVGMKFTPYEKEPRDETSETVRNLRILLNKLSKDNFARISDTILNNFQFTKEILQQFARILFNKCIKEPNYIEVYVKLEEQLFNKFKIPKTKQPGPENLNFRAVFMTYCQTTFENQENMDFLKELPADLDEEEIKQKKKQRIFGNMKLTGELFIRGHLEDRIAKDCIDKLLKENREDSVEILCHFLLTIGRKLYECFAFDSHQTTLKVRPKIKVKILKKEMIEDCIDQLIALKMTDKLSSRVKFMIQDVLDARDTEWINAFDFFPTPKIPGKNAEIIGLRKKTKSIEKQEPAAPAANNKAEDIKDSDPKLVQRDLRKKSVNEQNVMGINIEKFQKSNLEEKIRVSHTIH
jgi:translation initiation factor 4G